MKCPRAFFETEFNGDPKNLFFWTIQHYAARWYDITRWLDYYNNHINSDMKLRQIGLNLATKIRDRNQKIESIADESHSETPFLYKYKDLFLEGTADKLYCVDWEWYMVDFKTCKKADIYLSWDVRDEYFQHYGYTFLACEYLWIDGLWFEYIPMEKSNSARVHLSKVKRYITKEEAQKKVHEVLENYMFAKETGIHEENLNSWCKFCELASFCKKYYDAALDKRLG